MPILRQNIANLKSWRSTAGLIWSPKCMKTLLSGVYSGASYNEAVQHWGSYYYYYYLLLQLWPARHIVIILRKFLLWGPAIQVPQGHRTHSRASSWCSAGKKGLLTKALTSLGWCVHWNVGWEDCEAVSWVVLWWLISHRQILLGGICLYKAVSITKDCWQAHIHWKIVPFLFCYPVGSEEFCHIPGRTSAGVISWYRKAVGRIQVMLSSIWTMAPAR